jgi:NAD(P)-dependent dehydrogenase (short-subunit alcohol dehydrogenase family)
MRLKGKVAVVSGVGNRFGKATAFLFAKEGAKVILLSRTSSITKEVVEEVINQGGEAVYFECDVTNSEQVTKVVQEIISKFGKVDILFNNVGGSYTKKQMLEELDPDFWVDVIHNNLTSVYLLSKHVIPYMKAEGKGAIINVATASKPLIDGNNAYGTAKGGVVGMTKNLAAEYAKFNIKVNCVCPGVVRNNTKDYNFTDFTPNLNKSGQSEDIAFAVLFLACDESSWITGQTITIDGGEEVFVDVPKD